MAENRSQSSSEQYTKSSNRKLLFGGIILLVVFLVALAFISGSRKTVEAPEPIPYTNDDISSDITDIQSDPLFARGDADLQVSPDHIDMNNVVIGSKVEAVLTLTAANATPVEFLGMELAEQQTDGFSLETNCSSEVSIQPDKSCTIKVFWNPIALRQLQNNLIIRWKEDSKTSYAEKKTIIQIKAQSTDSKDCVICENVTAEEKKEPRMAMGLDGKMYEVNEDGTVTIDGKTYTITPNGVIVGEDGTILAVVEPEYVPINLNNEIMGSVDGTKVVGANGEDFGKILKDKTIVDTKLTVLGSAIPVVSVINAQGNVVGKLTKEGTVVDSTNKVTGKVWVDGQVFTLDNKPMGYVRPWGLVADFNGKIIGAIIPDATVIDGKNNTIGKVMPNGFVIGNQNDLIGATIPQGVGVGAGCQLLGKVLMNGDVKDGFDQTVGKVMLDGSIVNSAGEELGSVITNSMIINEKGNVIGYVNSEGKAINAAGAMIGCVNPDGTVVAGKKMIGSVMTRGFVIGNGCQPVGSVFPNGEVFDNTLSSVGRVMPDKFVKNSENKVIGIVVTRAAAIADGCRFVGLVSLTGQVIDMQNQPVGCVTMENTVINGSGETIGSIAKQGAVYNNAGELIGRTGFDGKVRDKDGKIIGCLNPDGTVVSPDGKIIGSVASEAGAILDENGNPRDWVQIGNQIYDKDGRLIGTVNKAGIVVSETGRYVAFIPRDGHIYSPDGLILGRYSSKVGYALNQNDERFGRILFDMTVVSGDTGDIIGGLIPDNTGFVDEKGTFLGKVVVGGTLRNADGEIIGAIRGDGTVIDKEGKIIGYQVIEGTVVSPTGMHIGTVTPTGAVVSERQTEIGRVLGNGLAVSSDGKKLLGGIVPVSALARDTTGLIGYLNIKGEVQGMTGEIIGRAFPGGIVVSDEGVAIARLTRLGAFTNNLGKTIGWTGLDGSLIGKDNKPLGKINALGLAFDRTNKLIGCMVKRDAAVSEKGTPITIVAVNNKLLQKEKPLATITDSPYIYGLDNTAMGRVLPAGIAVSNDGAFLGWTRADGTIVLGEKTLGTVLFDNRVVNNKGNIVGYYIALGSVAYDNEGRTVGFANLNGEVISLSGQKRGYIRSGNLVVDKNEIVGHLMSDMSYISNSLSGKANGMSQLNGTVLMAANGKMVGNLMMNGTVLSLARQVIGEQTVYGAPMTNAMSTLGNVALNGEVVLRGQTEGVVSGTKAIYNETGGLIGSVLPVGTVVGKSGSVIGFSSASPKVVGFGGKQNAVHMTFGTALLQDNTWVGGLLTSGLAVNDDAEPMGTISPDGVVLDQDNGVVGRVLSDGAVARVPDRELFNTMPYAGAVVTQGLPFDYRGSVIGTTTVNGDVLNMAGEKHLRILDDGTILGKTEPLSGAVLPFVTAVGQSGNLLGTLNGRGQVVSSTGMVAGKIAVNEAVKGAGEYEILGILVPRRTITNNCQLVGVSNYLGQVIDARGTVVGRVLPDKWVVNAAGDKIGRVTKSGIVMSNEGKYLGRTLPDSTVVDTKGVSIGCAQNDGKVVDESGNVIGGVIERGLVLGKDGKPIGRVKADGSVVDASGKKIGTVRADGAVINDKGEVIGFNVSRDQEILFNEDGTIKAILGTGGDVHDPKTGEHMFTVKGKDVLDPEGNKIDEYENGKFKNGGDDQTLLKDKDGKVFGIVSGCDVLNTYGEKIGSIQTNGDVIDLNGDVYAKILGDGTIMKDDEVIGKVTGTNTRLDRCGIQTKTTEELQREAEGIGSGGLSGAPSARSIFIGKQKYGITETGSIVNADGTAIGYMGEDGKPYTLDNRQLTTSGDSTGRSRPNVVQRPKMTPEQAMQIQNLLKNKRQKMGDRIKNTIKPDGRILAKGKPKRASDWGDMATRSVSSWQVDMSRMILQDKAIPAVIVRSIDSRYKEVPVTAIVERHIYSEKGRNIIIPAGSRVIGKMTGSPGTDKVAKMEISWQRLIRPDGGMFKFEAMSGDAQGRGGVAAYLDDQLITKYGKPIMTSVVTSAVSYMMATNEDYNSNVETGVSTQSSKAEAANEARENFINAMDTIFQQLVAESTNVPPVVFVPSGTRITIFSNEDLWLRSEDDDVKEYTEAHPDDPGVEVAKTDSWVNNRTGGSDEDFTEVDQPQMDDDSSNNQEEEVDYYKPDDSYKAPVTPVGLNQPTKEGDDEPVYSGSKQALTEDIPLEERKSAPVLPKTGSPGRLF